jgi:hypothetical protein
MTVLGTVVTPPSNMNAAFTLISTVIGMSMLYGYAYERRLIHEILWRVMFFINAVIWVRAIILGTNKAVALGWSELNIGFFIFTSSVLAIAMLLVHFHYAFRSKQIWSHVHV